MTLFDARLAERLLSACDAAAAWPLSVEAGWNQTVEDWRFLLGAGRGIGVRDAAGRWIGTAVALPLGARLAWLCMVLVARDARRQGIGTHLLRRSIEAVRASRAVTGLDATELGRPVYRPLGFEDLYTISRWRREGGDRLPPVPQACLVRRLAAADFPALTAFDERHSGMSRGTVLGHLAARAPNRAFVAVNEGRLVGYALGRPGRLAAQVGPVMAVDGEVALALFHHALGASTEPTMIDVPDGHGVAVRWLQAGGAVRERGFTRMTLGEPPAGLGDAACIFALAGPELG